MKEGLIKPVDIMEVMDMIPQRVVTDKDGNPVLDEDGNAKVAPKYNSRHQLKKILNTNPRPEWVKVHPFQRGVKYIPIRVGEAILRELYPAHQVIIHGQPTMLANSISVTVEVKVYDVFFGWLSYYGIGCVPIQLEKAVYDKDKNLISGARNAIDFERINANGLHRVTPAAAGFAFSNAVKKIGVIFGSQLNSKADEIYRG